MEVSSIMPEDPEDLIPPEIIERHQHRGETLRIDIARHTRTHTPQEKQRTNNARHEYVSD